MNKIEALLLSIGLIFVIIGFFYKVFFPIFFICIGLIFLKRSIKEFTDKNVKKGIGNLFITIVFLIGMIISYINI